MTSMFVAVQAALKEDPASMEDPFIEWPEVEVEKPQQETGACLPQIFQQC